MRYHTPARFALAVPVLLSAQAAWADLTAAQVWGDWKQYMQSLGYSVSAGETANGADLTVSDIQMSMTLPDNGGTFSVGMGTLSFVQNGGAVDIQMPDVMPITLSTTQGPNPVTMQFNFTQSGQRMTASGTPETPTYDYSAQTMQFSLTELNADGQSFGPENAKIEITGTGVKSVTTMTLGDLRTYDQTGGMDALAYDIAIDNPNEPVKIKATGNIDGVAFDGGGAIPMSVLDSGDMAAMMAAGFAVQGAFSYTGGASNTDVTDPETGNFAATTSSQGGTLGMTLNKSTLAYNGTQNNVRVSVQAQQLPFPVEMSMARSGFNLAMPLSPSEQPQDFALGFTLGDFAMSDLIWSIFDPTAQLPRDPATIELDLTGKAKMLVNILDAEAAARTDAPGELHAMTLQNLLVSVAGARLEGNGDFTFDNSDLTTVPGMPKPVGVLNLALAGGNGLLNKLVAMGILPEQQAMGARITMGLIGVPGDGPDTLKSTIEFTEGGQIKANGQQIR